MNCSRMAARNIIVRRLLVLGARHGSDRRSEEQDAPRREIIELESSRRHAAIFNEEEKGRVAYDNVRKVVWLLMVLFENMHTLSCRSGHHSVFQVPLRNNPLLIAAVLAAHGIHIAAMFLPWFSEVLQVQPVAPQTRGVLLGPAASLLLLDEVAQLIRGRGGSEQAASA